jgi:hypothetical protein
MMDRVHKPSDSERYIESSEPDRFYRVVFVYVSMCVCVCMVKVDVLNFDV